MQVIQKKVHDLISLSLTSAADQNKPLHPVGLLGVCCTLHLLQVSVLSSWVCALSLIKHHV